MLRKQILAKKITPSKSFVEPKHLPSTKHSLKYHSYKVYFQILKWLNIPDIKAEDWGWKTVNNSLAPITTDHNTAPYKLLAITRCKCKTDCSTLRCSCKKYGLKCSHLCGTYQLNECSNMDNRIENESDREYDFDDLYEY